jgi:hypothetical protein
MALTKPKLSQNIDTDVSVFSDPILVLHQGSTSANLDVGFLMNRSNGLTSNAAVIWQESSKSFVHILTNDSGAPDANLTVQSYANVSVGNVLLINNAGIYVDGSLGSAGQVLASDGFKSFWAPPGGFTGGFVLNQTTFASNLVVSNTTPSTSNVTGALVVLGGAGIQGNVYADALYTRDGILWAGNGVAFTSGSTYGNANVAAYLVEQNITSANIGAFYNYANTKIGTNSDGNLVVVATTTSTSNVTGALVVGGGAGFAGNVYADKIYTSNGLYWAGNGNVIVTGGGGGGGGVFTASNTAPVGPNASDFWYYIAGDILFQYINDGDSNQWVDIISPVAPSSTVVSSLVLANVSISSVYNINSTKTALGIPPTVSSTAPVNPIRGDLWYDTDEDITYQYVFDGVGNAWVDISSAEFGFTNNSTALVDTTLHGNIIPSANVTYFLGNTNRAFGNIYANALHTFSGVYWAGNGNVFASGGGGTGSQAAAVGYSLVFGG